MLSKSQAHTVIQGILSGIEQAHIRGLVEAYGAEAADPRVIRHAERLQARELPAWAAFRQAAGMVQDRAHREACPICRGDEGG